MNPYFDDGQGIKIYHGDCREVLDHLKAIKFDLCFTDPPYVIKNIHGGGFGSSSGFYRGEKLSEMCDFNLSEYKSVLGCAPQLVAFHSRDQILSYATFCNNQFKAYDLHFWHKPNAIPFVNNTWKSDVEYIAVGWSTKKHAKVQQHIKSKVYTENILQSRVHPTQKPLGICMKYLRVLNPKSTIDPFMGSGSILRAAKDLGMSAIGIEHDEKYCEIAANRLRQGNLL